MGHLQMDEAGGYLGCSLTLNCSCSRRLLSYIDNLCKQFKPRSGPTKLINTKNAVIILDNTGNTGGMSVWPVLKSLQKQDLPASPV